MEPEPVQPGMLIDVCKYLDSLQYRVWRKMVTSVESGEWGCGQGYRKEGGTLREAQSQLHSSLLASHPVGPSPASCRQVPGALSTPSPTTQNPLAEPLSLGPDTRPPLQKEELAALSVRNWTV